MSILRWIAYLTTLLVIGFVLGVLFVIHNKDSFARLALERIGERTGLEIQISGTRLGLNGHLLIVLEHPRVFANQSELADLDDIRVVVSYNALVHGRALPMTRLVLDRPRVKLPPSNPKLNLAGIRNLNAQVVESFRNGLQALSDTVRRIDVINGAVTSSENMSLIENLYLRASRHRRRAVHRGWQLDLAANLSSPPVAGLQLTGRFSIGRPDRADLLAGRVWFWGLDLHDAEAGKISFSSELDGALQLQLDNRGILHGQTSVNARQLVLGGPVLIKRVAAGNWDFSSIFRAAPDELDLTKLVIRRDASKLLTGNIRIVRPLEESRGLSLDGEGITIELMRIAPMLRPIRGLPADLLQTAMRLNAGHLVFEQIALDSASPIRDWTAQTLRKDVRIQALLRDGGYQFPADWQIPALRRINAQIDYASGRLGVSQASAELGASQIVNLAAEADLRAFPSRMPYQLRSTASLDLTQLREPLLKAVALVKPAVGTEVTNLEGEIPAAIKLEGDLPNLQLRAPSDYRVETQLNQLRVSIKDAPTPIVLSTGTVLMQPASVSVKEMRLGPAGEPSGYINLNGAVQTSAKNPILHDFTIEPHEMPIGPWLPLLVPRENLTAEGRVGGSVVINGASGDGAIPDIKGRLTLTDGTLSLGFLRSPIATRAATLDFDGTGLVLDMPGSQLEGQPLNYRMAVADLAHPSVRIDASIGKLDFEVMRFIRVPWSHATPPHFFAAPVRGHIEAGAANFAKLPLAQVRTDFSRDSTDWEVSNFGAKVFDGEVRLNISGRARDDWINMKGRVAKIDAGSLVRMLNDGGGRAVLTGHLSADGDLVANTDVNFFDTLAGAIAIKVTDGRLDRLTLLSRVLGLINLKNWITAQVPDPRVAGLPFKTLKGNFAGKGGDFYTHDLMLQGPVMELTARGDVRLGSGEMNMEIAMLPLQSFNWIVHNIPLIGKNLSGGTKGIVAAYFQVRGPFKDPKVTPKPITSVGEFVKKMLAIPVNVIAPNTIQ